MTNDRETWLSQIRSNPSDWQAMLVFADWLEESGDLLAAEQWRWIAAVQSANAFDGSFPSQLWPAHPSIPGLFRYERMEIERRNIRCMPHYPLTIEDVQAYLERV